MNNSVHHGVAASLRRIRLVAQQTLGEALRMRMTSLLVLLGAGLVVGALKLQEFNFGSAELKFVGDFGLGAMGGLGTLLAALATAHLFFSEVQGRAAYCILTRPVRRWEYMWGKFIGVAGLLALFTASLGVLIGVILWWRGNQLGAPAPQLSIFFCACAVQWLKLTLVAAMTLLVCSYAGSALFASCAGLILALVAHLRSFAGEGGSISWLRVWPDLALFDAESLLASAEPPGTIVLLGIAGYWAAYVSIYAALASYSFARREF